MPDNTSHLRLVCLDRRTKVSRRQTSVQLKSDAFTATFQEASAQARNPRTHRIDAVSLQEMIVIIDDDEAVRTATESLVRSHGFKTKTFASAEEFLHCSQLGRASCVITDVQMPSFSGVELQAHLLKMGDNVPMIFVTAFPEDKTRQQVCKAGAVAFLPKPFDGNVMMDCIERALRSRSKGGAHV